MIVNAEKPEVIKLTVQRRHRDSVTNKIVPASLWPEHVGRFYSE
jgi:hypothetical protein